jgi:hypothetical protein
VNAKQLFEALARLPARAWLQGAFALVMLAVLAVLSFAVLAGIVVVALAVIFAFKAKAWFTRKLGGLPTAQPPARPDSRREAIDVKYEIVDKKDGDER